MRAMAQSRITLPPNWSLRRYGEGIIRPCYPMERSTPTMLRIGDWCADPASGQISRDGEKARLEERTMRLLLCLAEHAGEVVSIDDLLSQVWPGVNVTPDSVYQAVASLRRLLGDDPKQPAYIATVPRLGYRMVARVSPWTEQPVPEAGAKGGPSQVSEGRISASSQTGSDSSVRSERVRTWLLWTSVAGICAVLIALLVHTFRGNGAADNHSASAAVVPLPQKSIAVLPFLDLTEGMKEETFADGMTEELIDKLSKIQGLRVPPPTSSFYFKGKKLPVADIAKSLGVAYVLDGSVRKSSGWIRVDARLVRADNGYVVWSETYDRPVANILMIQDDIARQAAKALAASIEAATPH
jgi:transcriptional activator of cad operon